MFVYINFRVLIRKLYICYHYDNSMKKLTNLISSIFIGTSLLMNACEIPSNPEDKLENIINTQEFNKKNLTSIVAPNRFYHYYWI